MHQGMTSSDVLDTCFNVQLARAADILIADVDRLLAALKRRAFEHKMTPTIGRSHGIHAEPTTFGLKLASAYAEFARARERLLAAQKEIATCAISGAVGTFANIDPRVEAHVAKAMGLAVEPVSTQVIPRDRHAMYFATLGVVASSIERLATEIRHLQRTEVLEAEEFFSEGQKGSSAMPHKRNPVLTENLTGLARMVRAYALPALENVALWHERDISHSSVERMIGPDATVTLDFALARLAGVIDKLVVYPENMQKNLDRLGGLVHSQRVLLALTQKGVAREDAYRLVQRNAMPVWRGEGDFLDLLKADPDVMQAFSAKPSSKPVSISAITSSTSIRFSSACSAAVERPACKPMRKLLIGVAAVLLIGVGILAGMIMFGTSAPPPPLASIKEPFRNVDFSDVPPITRIVARDGTPLAVRIWNAGVPPAEATRVVIAIHGSSAMGSSLHPLAKVLRDAGFTVYAPDVRGHGSSGPRGDIGYTAQLDDDLADLVTAVRAAHPKAGLTLLGFSSGGGLALHAAGSPLGSQFERAILLSPMLGPFAPTTRGTANAWAAPYIPRIIALAILGRLGVHAFDGLPTLAFAIAPEDSERLTGVYSFRLMQAFGTLDYAADLRNAKCPIAVLVGGADELFFAEKFAATVHAERPEFPVTVIPGLGHIDMTTNTRAIPFILDAISVKQ